MRPRLLPRRGAGPPGRRNFDHAPVARAAPPREFILRQRRDDGNRCPIQPAPMRTFTSVIAPSERFVAGTPTTNFDPSSSQRATTERGIHGAPARRAKQFVCSIVACPYPAAKYFAGAVGQIRCIESSVSSRKRGVGQRHQRGTGCDGRGCTRTTNGVDADGEVVWS